MEQWFGLSLHNAAYDIEKQKLNIKGLYRKPDLALKPAIATKILIEGMEKGLCTGRPLDRYFNDTDEGWLNARDVVNPGSSRKHITAALGKDFFKCIE